MRRRTFLTLGTEGIKASEAMAADICLYNKTTEKLLIVKSADFSVESYPSENYSPVGVVVVPGTHNVYGDGSCAVIALKWLAGRDWDSEHNLKYGNVGPQNMYFGGNGVDFSTLNNFNKVCYIGLYDSVSSTVEGLREYGYLPSDNYNGLNNTYDTDTYYYSYSWELLPSPYLTNENRNPAYYQTSSPSSTENALSDFDGYGNTQKILALATGQPDWKTANDITYHDVGGYYGPVCCSWRYSPDGTSEGDWYLPAAGELGYVIAKLKKINQTLTLLKNTYGSSKVVILDGMLASSTESDSTNIRQVSINDGYFEYAAKNGYCYPRAFMRVR